MIGLDEDIVALSGSNVNRTNREGFHVRPLHLYNGHVVSRNGHIHENELARVDETKAVGLARRDIDCREQLGWIALTRAQAEQAVVEIGATDLTLWGNSFPVDQERVWIAHEKKGKREEAVELLSPSFNVPILEKEHLRATKDVITGV